jgi:hypothetical protein
VTLNYYWFTCLYLQTNSYNVLFFDFSGTKRTLCARDSQGIPGSSSVGAKSVTDGDATARLPLEPGIDGTNTQVIAPATGIVSIDDDKEDDEGHVGGNNQKRHKRCTSWVWEYFTKKNVVIEENGKKYEQVWGLCNFARCKAKYRVECNHGTTGFSNHLKSAHKIMKGQLQLSLEKDGKDITTIKPFRYDQDDSVKKIYLAIIMHEYPFNIVEHDYFVEFIKSLRPSFPLKSRVTARKDILDIYVLERDKLYAHLKTVPCRFSATMDMWTSCQNKGYMCVTIHWIDDEWHIQKRIVGFFHVDGRHTGHKLAESFTEVMVDWFVEKKCFL